VDVHSEVVYKKGAENLQKLIADGVMKQDGKECFYIYKQLMGEHEQYGLVALASVDEYDQNIVKKHEFTRPVKEDDRVAHIDALDAQVGPVFLTYKAQPAMDKLVKRITDDQAEIGFMADDEIEHTIWVIDNDKDIQEIKDIFAGLDSMYIADGHHRSAAASRIKKMRMEIGRAHV